MKFMNIFTRFLSQGANDRALRAFIEHWDRLEALVIQTYRTGIASPDHRDVYPTLRSWLREAHGRWATDLAPFWQKSSVGGTLDHGDPYLFILHHDEAIDFVDNWPAMQHLPAAREALNQLILTLTKEEDT